MSDTPNFQKKSSSEQGSGNEKKQDIFPPKSGSSWVESAELWSESVESELESAEPVEKKEEVLQEEPWFDTVKSQIKEVEAGTWVEEEAPPPNPWGPLGVIGGNPEPKKPEPIPGPNVMLPPEFPVEHRGKKEKRGKSSLLSLDPEEQKIKKEHREKHRTFVPPSQEITTSASEISEKQEIEEQQQLVEKFRPSEEELKSIQESLNAEYVDDSQEILAMLENSMPYEEVNPTSFHQGEFYNTDNFESQEISNPVAPEENLVDWEEQEEPFLLGSDSQDLEENKPVLPAIMKKASETEHEFEEYKEVEVAFLSQESNTVEKTQKTEKPQKSSLLDLKAPNIVIEKPISMKPPPPPPPKEEKPLQPLIQLQSPKIQMVTATPEEHEKPEDISYDDIFDLEFLPKKAYSPPVQEEEEEEEPLEETLAADHPLFELMEALKQPLPTERYAKPYLDNVSEEEVAENPEAYESNFDRMMRNMTQAPVKPAVVHTPKKQEILPEKNVSQRPRTPYKEESPLEMLKNWIKFWIKPDRTLKDDEKQYRLVAIMLGISLIIGLGTTSLYYLLTSSSNVVSVVQLDVNPSIQFSVNRKEIVLEVEALNPEAKELLGTVNYEGETLEHSLESMVSLLILYDYVQDSSTLLATVIDKQQTRGEALSVSAKEYVESALQQFDSVASAVGMWVDPEFELSSQAETEGIALGKWVIIKEILGMNPSFTVEKLEEFTQGELFQLFTLGSKVLPIGIDYAVELARQEALLSETDSYRTTVEIRLADPNSYYYVVFRTATKEFQVKIHGFQGTVLEILELSAYNVGLDMSVLPAEAKKIALDYVGVLEIQVENINIKQNWSKGRLSYVITFQRKDVYHTVTVFAATGEVDSYTKREVEEGTVKDLGQSAIQEIVFADAGVTKAQLASISMEQQIDGDNLVYIVAFWVSNRQYAYEVLGDGTIIRSQFEDFGEDTSQRNLFLVSETNAKDLALTHAGLSFSQVNQLTVTLNEEQNYEINFLSENIPFYYLISGESGEVLSYSKSEAEVSVEESENTPVEEEKVEVIADIGEEQAKQVALSVVNLKEVMIQSFEINSEGTGEEKKYTVEFVFSGIEYYYQISAVDGEILDEKRTKVELVLTQPTQTPSTPTISPEESYQNQLNDFNNSFSDFGTMFESFYNN